MTATLQEVRGQARLSTTLLGALLAAHGIMPLPREDVEKYKEQERHAAPASDWLGRYLDRKSDISTMELADKVESIFAGLLVFGVLGFLISGFTELLYFTRSGVSAPVWLDVVFITATVLAATPLIAGAILDDYGIGEARWVTVDPTEVRLPLFVANYIQRIRSWDNSIQFEVEDLQQNEYSLDPVLYAVRGDEREAVCIWKHGVEIRLP